MGKLEIIYLLITAGLTAIAIYVQVNSSAISLPISLGTTIITILLPLIAAANFFYYPILHRMSQQRSSLIQQFVLPGLQILQGVLTVILVTLSFEGLLPGPNIRCSLEENWKRLWIAHDGRAIERIQDAFSCCGLNTIKDRAWPQGQCPQLYGRHDPCAGPWRAAMQRNSGLGFAVAMTVGILQNERTSQAEGLLEDGDGSEENDSPNSPRRDYGAIDDRRSPRVEPSHLGEDRNHWES
ncbi:putative tetraspanin tsp3 protein [Eutypa lata UCREL1]|uniref:Putative tetraspanin tsp3 protein n=1 Tax=Eutypa lata (strain UCR-EL1) TaxID=1287681 RepID=M7U168_EUTLA|nr:putative tetraspanin tsp3 protein [Eutypa lata UCREL1]